MAVARVTTMVASSKTSWQDAALQECKRASKTLRGITGLQILDRTAAKAGDAGLAAYPEALEKSWVRDELYRARNIRPSFHMGRLHIFG